MAKVLKSFSKDTYKKVWDIKTNILTSSSTYTTVVGQMVIKSLYCLLTMFVFDYLNIFVMFLTAFFAVYANFLWKN